ncbi:MAG TPA: bis-aminopropyl spermidine synthase family protein [Streptosporangiaceae bacterium]|nr:bis-aminopropyl spermidine synthase family protein [Streptosporangiaceae bacterium]
MTTPPAPGAAPAPPGPPGPPGPAPGAAALADLMARQRPATRRLRGLVARLTEEPRDLAALVRQCALPRATVEAVLAAIAGDLVHDGAALAIMPEKIPGYRDQIGYAELRRTELADPLAERLAGAAPAVASLAELIAGAPPAFSDLDHVPATPETVVRRALWLDSTYDLAGAVLLCLGDHDLTSLAVGQVSPGAAVVVVDVDEATLEYIDSRAGTLGLSVRCFAGDLRFGLPAPAVSCADLVFTDPPYTPDGVGLFAARGLQGLANRDNGRLIVAYGYSERHPTLGYQAQSVAHRLGLAYEAVLPAFNRYTGAQAVGSASDLYVWRPTSRAWRAADRFAAAAGANIYTRGTHALEQGTAPRPEQGAAPGDVVPPAIIRETAGAGFPIRILVGDGWRRAEGAEGSAARLRLETLLAGGVPPGLAGRDPFALAADLSGDPGPWLLRVLLAANAGRVAVLVPAGHPDARSQAAQGALADLLRPKYALRFLHGQPDDRHAVVVAEAAGADTLTPAGKLARRLLRRAHGKVGNVWREGLIEVQRECGGSQLTKREARDAIGQAARQPDVLGDPLMALPRHAIARVLQDAAASAEPRR